MADTVGIEGSEARTFSIFTAPTTFSEMSQYRVFSIYNLPAESFQASQVRLLSPTTADDAPMEVSGMRTFTIVKGRIDNRRVRAWPFSLDGHDLYVIRLGESSTLVYDLTTEQWARWSSGDIGVWRANIGTNWIGLNSPLANTKVVIGDDTFGLLWTLDPNSGVDEHPRGLDDVPYTRRVVGGVPMRLRETQRVGAAYITADFGTPQLMGAQITLRTSDDNGKTFSDHGTITVDPGNYDQEFVWRSLGLIKAPGRIFEITDNGATCRIDGLDMR